MQETGIFRSVDEFGRFVVPKELRNIIGITDNIDYFDMYLDSSFLCFKKSNGDSTCMKRKVDKLGRIVIPREILNTLKFKTGSDYFKIFTDDEEIRLLKTSIECVFCNSSDDLTEYMNKSICKNCLEKLKTL